MPRTTTLSWASGAACIARGLRVRVLGINGAGLLKDMEKAADGDDDDDDMPELEAPEDVDETGLEEADINTVMGQVHCSRPEGSKSIKRQWGRRYQC